jgi:5-carboxymethyl-2-hydroxymuconate isomerase
MPHIIVEYSPALDEKIPTLLNDLHESLAASGIDKVRIKTRGIAINHSVVGLAGTDGLMMHATLLILEGRSYDVKKQYGDPLHALLKKAAPNNCAVTLEIRDMDKETYYL